MNIMYQAQELARSMILREALVEIFRTEPMTPIRRLPKTTTDEDDTIHPVSLTVEAQENENPVLKINNRPVGNVPPGCFLLISTDHANGEIWLTLVGERIQSEDASQEPSKPDTTGPTKT